IPANVTVRSYSPGITDGNTYNPASFVSVRRTVLVALLVSASLAPGMTELVWSRTVPRTPPLLDCANATLVKPMIRPSCPKCHCRPCIDSPFELGQWWRSDASFVYMPDL